MNEKHVNATKNKRITFVCNTLLIVSLSTFNLLHAESVAMNGAVHKQCVADVNAIEMVDLINQSRAVKQKCGHKRFKPVASLNHDCVLSEMAKSHAEDLKKHDILSHESSDGSTLFDRANKRSLKWRALAENVAEGYQTPGETQQAWLNSPPHCKNVMNENYNSVGVAEHEGFWVVVFGKL